MSTIRKIRVSGIDYDIDTVLGSNNIVSGSDAVIIGTNNRDNVSGTDESNVLIGWSNRGGYPSRDAIAIGRGNTVNAYSVAMGYHNTAANYSFVTGAYNNCTKPGVVANQHYAVSGVDDLYYNTPKESVAGSNSHAGFIGMETYMNTPFFSIELSDVLVATLQVINLQNSNMGTIMFSVKNCNIVSQQTVFGNITETVAISNGKLYIGSLYSDPVQLAMWYNLASSAGGSSGTGSGSGGYTGSWSSGSSSGLYT